MNEIFEIKELREVKGAIKNDINYGVELSEAEKQLRYGAIPALFRKFAIPGIVGLLFMGLQSILDGVILGNFVGANALASVSLVFPCYSFMVAVAVMLGIGCQTLVSINLGSQNRQGANDALTTAFIFILGFAFLSTLLILFFASDIARLLGANDVLIEGSVQYIRGWAPFFPVITAMFFSDYMLKSIGRPKYAMAIMSGTVIVNAALNILFVAVYEMGTFGAGLATGISFTVGAMFSLPVILGKKNIISVMFGRFNRRLIWPMFYNGSSEGMSELSTGITTLMFNLALMKYFGESGVAAFTAIGYVFFIGVIVFLGVSDGIIPIISYNYGANLWSRIKEVLRLAIKTNFLIGLTLFVMLTFFGEHIISLFFRNDEEAVVDLAAKGISIYAFAFLLNGLNILASGYFTALANAKVSIIISVLRGLVFTLIGITVFPVVFGVGGIWYTVPVAELCTFGVSYFLVRKSLRAMR